MEFLFNRLWSKSEPSPKLITPDGLFVAVPNTLEIVEGEPVAWYFSTKEHELKRKHSWKLTLKDLKKAFARGSSGTADDLVMNTGIACTYTQWNEVR